MKPLKTHIIFWFLWVGNPVRLSWVTRLRVSHRLQPRCWSRPKSSQAQLGKDLHPGSLVNDHWQFFTAYWTKDLNSSAATVWKPPSVPCHKGLSVGQLITWEMVGGWRGAGEEEGEGDKGREAERASRRECV